VPVAYSRESIEAAALALDFSARPDLAAWYRATQAGEGYPAISAMWRDDPAFLPGQLILLGSCALPPRPPSSFWLAFAPGPELWTIAVSGVVGIGPPSEPPVYFSVATEPVRAFLREHGR
jgi:hypothetical protein